MMCKLCGKEFGDSEICQHCGADKVSALGEFSGYSIPKKSTNAEPYSSEYCSSSHSVSPRIEDIPSMICWKCGEVIPGDSKYCPVCGTLLFATCPKCGHMYSAKYSICNQCGTSREEFKKAKDDRNYNDELQKQRQKEALRQTEREKLAHLLEVENSKKAMTSELRLSKIFDKVYNYIKEMAVYFELNSSFINFAPTVKIHYLESYVINHYPIDARVEIVVQAIIRDKTYWCRRDCLNEESLEAECINAILYVHGEM